MCVEWTRQVTVTVYPVQNSQRWLKTAIANQNIQCYLLVAFSAATAAQSGHIICDIGVE